MTLSVSRLFIAALGLFVPVIASAHTFLIKMDAQQNQQQARVMLTEKYFEGERELDPSQLQLDYISAAGTQAVAVKQTEKAKELTAQVPTAAVTTVVAASMAPRYRGLEKGKPASTPAHTLRIDNFAKTLVKGKADVAVDYALTSGQTLEIVPLSDPYALSAKTLKLQVLFNGKPVETKIRAGLANEKATAYETDAQGMVSINDLKPGVWLIRTKVENQQHDDKSEHYEASASLLFEIGDTP